MIRGALEVGSPEVPLPSQRGSGASLRIVCPTYWYPQHADDTQATYVHDINRHLVRRGHQVTVVTPGDRSLPSSDSFDGVDVVRFPMELPSDLTYGRVAQGQVSMLGRFARLAVMSHYMEAQYRAAVSVGRERGADVLHAHWAIPTGPAAVMAARRLKVPSVITMHGGDVYVNPEQGYDFPTRWYVRPPLKWTLNHVSALTAITEDCRQHALRAGAPDQAIRLIFNGTDLRRFSPSPTGNRVDPRFGPQMIFACRQLFPRKGIRFLVEAVAQLKPQFPNLRLVLAGDGFERPALHAARRGAWHRRRRHLPRLGSQRRPAAVLPRARFCPSSRRSRRDSASRPPRRWAARSRWWRVMRAGCPRWSSTASPASWCPGAMRRRSPTAIGSLLGDPERRRRMGVAGRERALRLFDWDRSAEQFERLYLEVGARVSR